MMHLGIGGQLKEFFVSTSPQFIPFRSFILTLNRHADDHEGLWPSRGAGQYTDEILQTVRDPTSLSAQR